MLLAINEPETENKRLPVTIASTLRRVIGRFIRRRFAQFRASALSL
jgi:hypothetical protein